MTPRNTYSWKPGTGAAAADFSPLLIVAAILCIAFSLVGCTKPIDINVAAEEPIKVDVSMDVHVYQHGGAEPDDAKEARKTYKDTMARKRDRMAEVQTLKDNRLVGESIEGILSIRNLPAGEYGTYVKKTVDAENDDRNFLIAYEAEQKSKPIAEVRREQWRHAQRKSFPGEWIQVQSETEPGTFRWIQKVKAE